MRLICASTFIIFWLFPWTTPTLVLLSFAPSDPIAQVSVSARCVTIWFNKNFPYIERNPIAADDIFFTRNNWSLFLLILALLEYISETWFTKESEFPYCAQLIFFFVFWKVCSAYFQLIQCLWFYCMAIVHLLAEIMLRKHLLTKFLKPVCIYIFTLLADASSMVYNCHVCISRIKRN